MNFQYGLSAASIGVSVAIVQPQVARALSVSEVALPKPNTVQAESAPHTEQSATEYYPSAYQNFHFPSPEVDR
ncbi:MAG: hypothetical protein HC852_18270 [Acaryochloridaceae cyanobacterium RU_4_10]|nr:hypothetical protein [Acaryochloridaceae cyanobacterium RU_4_10]